MTSTMTSVGLDVHARSTHAAAIDRDSGDLMRARFGVGTEPVVEWLRSLPQPVYACYEAGARSIGRPRRPGCASTLSLPRRRRGRLVIASRPIARTPSCWCGSCFAGSLTPVAVPSPTFEAARDLARAREQVRADLARVRHRVSKLLLRHGRAYDRSDGTWTQEHRRWLGAQRFSHPPTELAYLDHLAAIDGLLARRAALDERLSRIAQDDELWPTVARLRCFRGIETLTALVLCLEIGDFVRFQRPAQLASWLGLVPSLNQSGESETRGGIT